MVFDVEDPSLAFIGFVRPVVGSLVAIAELQARWAAKLYAGKLQMKSLEERRKDVIEDTAYWSSYFKDSSQRLQGLVEGYAYSDDLAHHAQIYPDYWALFRKNPRHWRVAMFAPYNNATYRLNEPDKLEQAVKTMRGHWRENLWPLLYLLLLFMRLIWFDWWLDKLAIVKYRIQTSYWWPTVRSWRVTRYLNFLWTIPKKVIFDDWSDGSTELSTRAKLIINSTRMAQKKQV